MLENFRKRDGSAQRPQTPYGQLQEALSPTDVSRQEAPRTESKETARAETSKTEAPNAETPRAPAAEEGVSKLIVGPDIKLRGAEITDCDTLVVEGRVEASMDSRVIQIAERGVFVGNVCIDIAEIHGHFEGELTARKQLVIHSTGHVSGKIRYGKVSIQEGGELSGDIAAIDKSSSASSEPKQASATVFPTSSSANAAANSAANGVLVARQSSAQR
jgi:cytoskeletal protein CcmA (bactofilin family)